MRISDRLTGLLAEAAMEKTHFLNGFRKENGDRKKAMIKYLDRFLQGKEEKALLKAGKVYPDIQMDCPTYDFISMYGIHPLAAEIIHQELREYITTGFLAIETGKDINGQSAIYKSKADNKEDETWQILFGDDVEWYSGGKIFLKTSRLPETIVTALPNMPLRDFLSHPVFDKYDFNIQKADFGSVKTVKDNDFLYIQLKDLDFLDVEEMMDNWKS